MAAYRDAARVIDSLPEDIEEVYKQGRLQDLPRIGPSLAQKIGEYLETGKSTYLAKLLPSVPRSVTELLEVPGIGPRKAQLIHRELGVKTVKELEEAARDHRLQAVPGIGPITEEKILREVERLQQRSGRLLLSVAWPAADEVAEAIRRHPAVQRVDPAGSIRRRKETIGDIDLLAASTRPSEVVDAFSRLPMVKEIIAKGPVKSSILTSKNLQIDLLVIDPSTYGAALQHFTGSREHNIALRDLAIRQGYRLSEYGLVSLSDNKLVAGKREEDIYRALGMQCPPPEMRENRGEIELAAEGKLPHLVTQSDIKGDLHVHSDWSDGAATLEEMVKAAIKRGYEYIAITDHSQSLAVAHGLSVERVREQHRLIDSLNEKYAPFRILASTEVEIRGNGTLDYDDEILREFDIVTASLHSGRGQSRQKVTERVIRAIRNPNVHILNHPSGRLIGKREPYEVDLEEVIKEAAATGTAIEINGSPERLDLNDIWARYAAEMGVLLAISTDAHTPDTLSFVKYSLTVARRAWLEPRNVLNAMPLPELLATFRRLGKAA